MACGALRDVSGSDLVWKGHLVRRFPNALQADGKGVQDGHCTGKDCFDEEVRLRELEVPGRPRRRHERTSKATVMPAADLVPSWRHAFFLAHRQHPLELMRLAESGSCLVMIHGQVYDLTNFLGNHPGGEAILWEHASTDATVPFERFLHSKTAREVAQGFLIWDGVAAMGAKGTLWSYRDGRGEKESSNPSAIAWAAEGKE
ncbi:unnamed protein product [Discosporangium mesarthrocarpum]